MHVSGWQKVNTWRIKDPLLVIAFLLGFFDHALHWGGATFAAAIAIALPIIGFRDSWREWKFWVTAGSLAFFQIPLVLAMRTLVEKPGFPLMFAFTIIDGMLVVFAVAYVCCKDDGDARRGVGKT